jgi:hypothetical protein
MKRFDFNQRLTADRLNEFASYIKQISRDIGFKVSSRGWGYLMEQSGLITKNEFDKVEKTINRCRKEGILPVDFVAEEASREFKEVHIPTSDSEEVHLASWLNAGLESHRYYHPDWWDGEKYYIQMVVEKIDLVTLFQPICRQFHIPIANSRGWSSILQRAEYAKRFKEAEDRGLQCVLLYCGDHDPDGLLISDSLRKNLEDIKDIYWSGNGGDGYDPEDLIIDRFGLDFEFIEKNKFTWIDNLITGSGKDLGNPMHKNHKQPYIQKYLRTVGERKCEANAIIAKPTIGRDLCLEAIVSYVGPKALDRFDARKKVVVDRINELLEEFDLKEAIEAAIKELEDRG